MDELKCIYSRTKTIQEDKVSGFCPGCMHSTVIKLIGEVLDELDVVDKAVLITGIGCCGLHMDYIAYDTITAPHGRACAVATGQAVFYIPGRRRLCVHRSGRVCIRCKPRREYYGYLH